MEDTLVTQAESMIQTIEQIENENNAAIRMRKFLEDNINALVEKNNTSKEALDIATHAIEILREVSDEAVSKAYGFLEKNLNTSLERMFKNSTRKIRIKEYTRANQYPQLELELDVGNGITRSLKTDSGHGLAQIVSLLSILSLIVITGSRRLLIIDEVLSGLSVRNRQIVESILWNFTDIGFQFIVNDHGFVIKGSEVYHLEMNGDVSTVKHKYKATHGVYLQGNDVVDYNYTEENMPNQDLSEMTDEFNNQLNSLMTDKAVVSNANNDSEDTTSDDIVSL